MNTYRRFFNRHSNISGGAVGLLIGLGLGAATALLLAPQSGRRTRKALLRRYQEAKDVLADWSGHAEELWDRGSDWAHDAREKVAPISQAMRRRVG